MADSQPTQATALAQSLGILALALLVRIAWWHFGGLTIEDEGAHYARVGESLASGHGYLGLDDNAQLIYPPLYPGLIAAGTLAGLSSEVAGRLASLLFGSLAAVLFAAVSRKLYGRRVGILAGVLAAIHPLLATASINVLSESTYLFFILAGLLQFLRLLDSITLPRSLVCGITFGAAYLCRPEAFFLTLLLTLLLAAVHVGNFKRAIPACMALLIGLFACATPYVAFLHGQTGQWRIEAKSPEATMYHAGMASNQDKNEIFWGIDFKLEGTGISTSSDLAHVKLQVPPLLQRVKSAYWQLLANLPELARALQHLQFGGLLMSLLIGLGLFAAPWNASRALRESPLLLMASLSIGTFLVWPFIRDRTLFMLIAPATIWAANGIGHLHDWALGTSGTFGARQVLARLSGVTTVVIALLLLGAQAWTGVNGSDEMSEPWRNEPVQAEVGRWLTTVQPRPVLADTTPTITYYAHGTIVRLPWTDGTTALRYLAHHNVEFVVLHSDNLQRRPYLQEWFASASANNLVLLKTFKARKGEIRIYKLGAVSVAQ
jgi:4-amino-4-deoxy-L-arabinose transferase-like glycosyltransferase